MIDKKASISNAFLAPRPTSIIVKEPIKRKSINMIPDTGPSTERIQISMTVLVWFLMKSVFKVLIRKLI
jgi:hypothetical protein